MVGLPSELDDDSDECVEFVTERSHTMPIALGSAPFAPSAARRSTAASSPGSTWCGSG
jgi:hypothetical protein